MRVLATALAVCALGVGPAAAQELFRTAYPLASDLPHTADEASAAGAVSFARTAEPLAFHRNPALLVGLGRQGGTYSTVAGSRDVGFASSATTAYGVATGADGVGGLPLAIGVGVSRSTLDDEPQRWTDIEGNDLGALDPGDTAWSGAIGAGWSGPVEVDLGVAVHRRASRPVVTLFGDTFSRARGTTLDAGAVLTAPVFGRGGGTGLAPILDLSTGYVQRHVALAASLPEPWEATGRPSTVRTSTLGYGVRAGLGVPLGTDRVTALLVDARVEADADLDRDDAIRVAPDGTVLESEFVRDALLGNLDVGTVLLGDQGDRVTGRRAIRVSAFDVLAYTRGHLEGPRAGWTSTWGLSIDGGAALRLVGLATRDARLTRIGDRATLRAGFGVQSDSDGLYRSTYGGLTVGWRP